MQKLLIIGLGNVGINFATAFSKIDNIELSLYTRNRKKLKDISTLLKCDFIDNLTEVNNKNFDFILLCVSDDAINEVINQLKSDNLIAYSAGAVDINQFKDKNVGVFYPLQTFSTGNLINLENVPLFIEAKSSKNEKLLIELAQKISSRTHLADSEYRKQLHIAAVFVNNFSHFVLSQGKEHCKKKNILFEHLFPLMEQTINNIKTEDSKKHQTGPAKRGDKGTIDTHLKELKGVQKEVYQFLSTAIAKENGKEL